MSKITYEDKQAIQNDESIANKNKVTADDMNEIKKVVNENAEEIKEKAAEIKAENVRLRSDINSISLVGEVEGESIDLDDSSDARFLEFRFGGNHKQKTREGYNLLDFNVTQDNRVTYNEDGSITINGVGAFSLNFNQITLEANKTYKQKMQLISGTIKDSSGKDMKDSAIMSFSSNVWLNTTKSSTYSKAEETSKSSAWVHQDAIFDNAKIKIWAYEGTEEKPYEQYGASPSPDYPSEIKTVSGSVEINVVNKNWFKNYEKKEINNFGIKLNIDKNVLKFDGSVSSTNYPSFRFYADGSIETNQFWAGKGNINGAKGFFDNNTINKVFSLFSTGTLSTTSSVKIRLTIGYETQLKNVDVYNFKNILSVLSDVNERINFIAIGFSPNTNVLLTASMQIEKGSTATDFVEHQEQTITMPVQQEMLQGDYFDFENKKEVHNWEKLILTGNEDYTNPQTNLYNLGNLNKKSIPNLNLVVLQSNKYKAVKSVNTNNEFLNENADVDYVCGFHTNQTGIRIKDARFSSLTEFKNNIKQQYDAGTPVIVYYKLATPIELDFTDEQKAVAKQIKETLHTYKNVTHIFSDDEVSPIFNVKYAKDPNVKNDNLQKQIDEIKQLLSTTQTSALLLDNLQKDVEREVE